jgi:hypothetical protein
MLNFHAGNAHREKTPGASVSKRGIGTDDVFDQFRLAV